MTSSNKQDELRGECSGSKASRQPSGSADPGSSIPTRGPDWQITLRPIYGSHAVKKPDLSPERAEILSLRKGLDKAFSSEGAVLASRYKLLGKYRAARAQIKIERSKTIAARAGCQSLAAKRDKFKLEADGLREGIARIKAEREAAEDGYKDDIGALEAEAEHAREIQKAASAECSKVQRAFTSLSDENEKLKAQVAEFSSKLIVNKPVTFDANGARFELHRILTQGGTRAEVLARVKNLRDRFGGDPSGEPGWTP